MKKSAFVYAGPDETALRSSAILSLLKEAQHAAMQAVRYDTYPRAAKDRRKLRITVIIEEVK